MGLLSGTLRIRRYQPQCHAPDDLAEVVQKYAFGGFQEGDEREEVAGWVSAGDPYAAPTDIRVGNRIALGLRVDRKRIPGRFLRESCRATEEVWKLRGGREVLTRAERDEIKTIVRKQLLERAIPSMGVAEMVWDLERGVVLFTNTSEKQNELFRHLFQVTFGGALLLLFPYSLAVQTCGPELVDRILPATFCP